MEVISKTNKQNLPSLLRRLPIHDSVYKRIEYNKAEKKLWITTQNAYEKSEIDMTFGGVLLLLSTDFGTQDATWNALHGNDQSISCLVTKECETFIEQFLGASKQSVKDNLYFLLESLSGGKMHILCETFSVHVRKTD